MDLRLCVSQNHQTFLLHAYLNGSRKVFDLKYIATPTYMINARRACARGLVCLFVCYQSPGFFSRLYDKLDIPSRSSLVFLGFQLTGFDKTVSFSFFGAFHGYFVAYERFRILFVANCHVARECAVLFLPTQQIRSIADRECMNGAAALSLSVGV